MFKYTIELRKPNSTEWEPLKSWARPFTDGTTLDDTLDEGCINLSCTTRSEAIPPFSRIRITISESDEKGNYKQVGQIIRVVGNTKRTRRTYSSSSPTLWDWNIQTLEETKLLERYICDSMMSTNYLSKDYEGGFNAVSGILTSSGESPNNLTIKDSVQIFSPYQQGYTLTLPTFDELLSLPKDINIGVLPLVRYELENPTLLVKSPLDESIELGSSTQKHRITFNEVGTYQIEYRGTYTRSEYENGVFHTTYRYSYSYLFSIGIFEHVTPRTDHTITSVCERLLSAGVTRRQGIEKQKFELDEAFANKYRDVIAPEFSFTRQTLFEALLTVGGYIHAIPRLDTKVDEKTGEEKQVVTFDELGGNDEIDMTDFPKQVYCDKVQNINDFCSTLDSPAQNLLNTQDRVSGAITELGNDYITVRAENAEVIIDADTAIIRTSLPINQIVKLECGYIDGRSEPVGDITAYVYESSEYDVLSSYSGTAYPYSKAFALRYAQGDNKITGLQTKLQYSTSTEQNLASPAIINIIQAVTKKKISTTEIHKLAFRVTYIPIVTSRVLQRKPYGNVGGANNNAGWDNSLVYNQGGNMVESSFYGDKMKGAIARLGNEVEQRTYDFYDYAQLPKCGQKLDGMYIARIDAEYDITRIRATLTLTKDFNMLSQYVGLNSNARMYDISEKQSVERFINYSENCYVGDEDGKSGYPMLRGIEQLIKGTINRNSNYRVRIAYVTGKDKDGNDIGNPVVLPVMAFGFGNSLAFTFSMYDNYGAGFQNSNVFKVNSKYKGVQRLVPYADGLGEMETMSVSMYNNLWEPTAADQEPEGNANLYPSYNGKLPTSVNMLISTGNKPLIVQKDSREALTVVYQMHFVATRDSIVLGAGLTQSNAYVTDYKNSKTQCLLYLFKNKLNMLDAVIDLSSPNALYIDTVAIPHPSKDPTLVVGAKVLFFRKPPTINDTYSAWAIIETENSKSKIGKLVIGENVNILPNELPPSIYFTMKSNE